MKKINKTTFEKIYEQHNNWLNGKKNGQQLNLVECSFTKDCLKGTNLRKSIFEKCDFNNCDLTDTTFENSIIQNCNFENSSFLSINAFGFSKISGTKLPFSYSNKIEAINDHCSKYKLVSLLYFIICVYYILFSINASYADFFMNKKIDIPNPFFNLTETISYTGMLVFGIIVVFLFDRFLIPLTLEIMSMIRSLPIIFPDGEALSTYLSKYFLLRWVAEFQIDFNGKLPTDNLQHQYFKNKVLQNDYRNIANNTLAFYGFLNSICMYLFLFRISHIYYSAYFDIDEQTLQMILGLFFIMSIKRSCHCIHVITILLLGLTLAVFLDYHGIGTIISNFLTGNSESIIDLSVLLAMISVASYHLLFKKGRMYSALPVWITMIMIVFSHNYLANVSLDGIQLNEWSGKCVDKKVEILENKRFQNVSLRNIQASNIDFKNSDLKYANLKDDDLRCSDFTNADLKGMDVENSDLINAIGIEKSICKTKNYLKAKLSFVPDCS